MRVCVSVCAHVCVLVCVCAFDSFVHTCFIFLASVARVCASSNIAGVKESLCSRLKNTGRKKGEKEEWTEIKREGGRKEGREGGKEGEWDGWR